MDVVFINPSGRLTLVECKLWRNPEARRKVIAQILDYARAVSGWSYADLQRRVAAATGRKGNVPFKAARELQQDLDEAAFVDATARALREGRFLLLIAGDGICEGISGMADLITRNAALGFSFGLVEVALYQFGEQGLLVQPRVVARTETIERTFVHLQTCDGSALQEVAEEAEVEVRGEAPSMSDERAWWEPLTRISFDDPEQEAPTYRPRNHVRVSMPYPGIWLTAFRSMGGMVSVACFALAPSRRPSRYSTVSTRSVSRSSPSSPRGATAADPTVTLASPAMLSSVTSPVTANAASGWRSSSTSSSTPCARV
ncbi:hypothetical protein [Vreelandella massiliensis]|uniref:hypothetical protein n=1 Tax=Vreelandella massiliensis TaxID=1816686 RepID=UPI001B3149BE|nr:hypothetical protein [Halomonas massiliensis]